VCSRECAETKNEMITTAWNNGAHNSSGSGYGLKVSIQDRDRYFQRDWSNVVLELDDMKTPIEVNVRKSSFWSATCRELISRDIGQWLINNKRVPWPQGKPPKIVLEPLGSNRFSAKFLDKVDMSL